MERLIFGSFNQPISQDELVKMSEDLRDRVHEDADRSESEQVGPKPINANVKVVDELVGKLEN